MCPLPTQSSQLAQSAGLDPLPESNINREQSTWVFSIAWPRLAAWDS